MHGIIYLAYNRVNQKKYVGATTKKLEARIKTHFESAFTTKSTYFANELYLYGIDNFEFVKIDEAQNSNELAEKEKYYIWSFDTMNNGYNLNRGGGFRKTIYQYELGNQEHIATYDTLQEAADAVNASRKSISNACLGYNQTCMGFAWSYSTTNPLDVKDKPSVVHQYGLDGELLNTFSSAREASKQLGLRLPSITRCCRGERKQTSGFRFTYG